MIRPNREQTPDVSPTWVQSEPYLSLDMVAGQLATERIEEWYTDYWHSPVILQSSRLVGQDFQSEPHFLSDICKYIKV